MLLPKKVGHFTLMRKLGIDAVTENYVAILDDPAGKQVVARRVHAAVASDPALMSRIEARVRDLVAIRHPAVASVQPIEVIEGHPYVLEEWVDGVSLERIIGTANRDSRSSLPHNVFLDLAAQACNGLEAMHGRPGSDTGLENVLHLGLTPDNVVVREDGQLVLTGHGLVASPTILPQVQSAGSHSRMEYLAPEQTHPDQAPTPATDVFALGSILYELLTLRPMFRADSNLQTVQRVRKAEVTSELLQVKEVLPGLDRVLYRALSVNPRHRYQRAFVLREDLRGLMAGYSFADIQGDARHALKQYFGRSFDEPVIPPGAEPSLENTGTLLREGMSALFDADTAPPVDHDAPTGPEASAPIDYGAVTAPGAQMASMHEIQTAPIARPKAPPSDVVTAPFTAGPLGDDGTTASFLRAVQGMDVPATSNASADVAPAVEPADTMAFIRAASDGSDAPEPPLGGPPTREELPGPSVAPIATLAPRAISATPLSVLDTQEREAPVYPRDQSAGLATVEEAAPITESLPVEPTAATEEAEQAEAAEALAVAAARQRLAPPDSLVPPASEPPARNRISAPSAPVEPVYDDLVERQGMPWLPFAVGGAIAAVALLACLGLGGVGTLFGASQVVAASDSPRAPAQPDVGIAAVAPEPVEAAAAAPPNPTPAPVASAAPSAEPMPVRAAPVRPDPAPSVPERPQPTPTPRTKPLPPAPAAASAPPPAAPAASTYDAVAAADDATQAEMGIADDESFGPIDREVLGRLAAPAFTGSLGGADRDALAAVGPDDPMFTRAHTLLYLDAKASNDGNRRDQQLATLMALPENQYNPALLVEEAWVAIGRRDWSTALSRSDRAERHWARLPSDLIFSRKAMIYEIQAKAHLGSFYATEGEDALQLDLAIKGWQRYRRHAETQARSDMMATADQQLARLYDIQRRLE